MSKTKKYKLKLDYTADEIDELKKTKQRLQESYEGNTSDSSRGNGNWLRSAQKLGGKI